MSPQGETYNSCIAPPYMEVILFFFYLCMSNKDFLQIIMCKIVFYLEKTLHFLDKKYRLYYQSFANVYKDLQ